MFRFEEEVTFMLQDEEALTFEPRRRDGRPLMVLSVSFVECESGDPLWVIVPDTIAGYLPFEIVNGSTGYGIEVDGPEGERFREAGGRDTSEEYVDSLARTLQSVTYGLVPSGFRQVLPQTGKPRALRRGDHLVQVSGAGRWINGSALFRWSGDMWVAQQRDSADGAPR